MGGSAHVSLTLMVLYAGAGIKGYTMRDPSTWLAGITSAFGMGVSGGLIQQGHDFAGHCVGTAVSATAGVFMTRRWRSLKHPFIPAGLLSVLSAFGVGYNLNKAIEWNDTHW
eukprot:TRINITY_DN7221_c0_g1_i1.p1 TRINITY_DN7221_c0_g1~~TRINITY_DN7221_c0_g1_i1.p1  ORF type:complete len:112 (+),score=12.64 TRINITY_DN7221_c0_g1_i1:197-532(+)